MAKPNLKYYEEDKEFKRMEDCAEKAELAISRLENPYSLTDENWQMYADWLFKTGPKVVSEFTDANKITMFPLLVRHRVIRKGNINSMVDYAHEKRRTDILSYLLNAGNDLRLHPKTLDIAPKFKRGGQPVAQKLPDYESLKQGQIIWLGESPMPWQVMEKKDGKVYIISKYAFDCMAYNNTFYHKSWDECALSKWLNGEFFNWFFSQGEKDLVTSVYFDKDDKLHTQPVENAVGHKMYTLSQEEAIRYFPTEESRRARVTLLGKRRVLWQSFDVYAHWWLRTPSLDRYAGQSHVLYDGGISRYGGVIQSNGFDQFYDHYGVRPAMCLTF